MEHWYKENKLSFIIEQIISIYLRYLSLKSIFFFIFTKRWKTNIVPHSKKYILYYTQKLILKYICFWSRYYQNIKNQREKKSNTKPQVRMSREKNIILYYRRICLPESMNSPVVVGWVSVMSLNVVFSPETGSILVHRGSSISSTSQKLADSSTLPYILS